MDGAGQTATVSVIVPVRDDAEGLSRCLAGLARQDYPRQLTEILVVDNGSSQPLGDVVARWPSVRLVHEPQPGSYSARNRGLSLATGEFIAFTDADCVPSPGWLKEGLRVAQAAPRAGIVVGAVRVWPAHDGRPRGVELWEMLHAFPQQRYAEAFHWGATANIITRMSVFRTVGDFRSDLMSGGDKEWGLRVHAAGFDVVYASDAVVTHPPRDSWSAHYSKLRRVFAGEFALRAVTGEPVAELGRVTPRRLVPPLGTAFRGLTDARLVGFSQKVRYAGAACVARYLGVLAGRRVRASQEVARAASAAGSRR